MDNLRKKRTNIINIRKKRKLSQAVVAKYFGITSNYYSQIETGYRSPGREVAIKIADFYGIDVRSL